MLAYAFQVLNEDSYAKMATEEFDNIGDLFAAILAIGIGKQIKRGLGKEYIRNTEVLSFPRGKINVSDSLKQRTLLKKQLACEFDEFSVNAYMNRILKTTAMLLIRSDDVRVEQKKALKKVMLPFHEVDMIDPHSIVWSGIAYHRNNATYKMLINICYLVIKRLLLTSKGGSKKLATFLDEQRMHKLFEIFVLAYYKKHYPQFHATPSQIDWNTDDGIIDFLPTRKSRQTTST
jgi:5-methylcytosine-specific restriction enzyme subunit McrC